MAARLSICIPTYNRSELLKECVSSVLASVAGHESKVEIVVSDNASTDGTADVVRAIQDTYPWIRFHRNEQNIGAERNFHLLATLAQGTNIWIFGDDDKMEREAVERVLEKVESGYGLVICNYSVWDKAYSVMKTNDGLDIGKDRAFEDRDELLKRFNLHLSYISSVVIGKAAFLEATRDEYWQFISCGFSYMYAVYAGFTRMSGPAAYIAAPIVCNRSENSGDYDWYRYFVAGSSLIFEALLGKGYAKDAISHAKHRALADFVIPNMLYMKLRDDYDHKKAFNLMYRHFGSDWLFWTMCLPRWLMPTVVIRLVRNVARMVRKAQALVGAGIGVGRTTRS